MGNMKAPPIQLELLVSCSAPAENLPRPEPKSRTNPDVWNSPALPCSPPAAAEVAKQGENKPPANSNKADRIAARLIPWTDSPQNRGRTRLRGDKRGRPSRATEDRIDVEIAASELAGALEMLRRCESGAMERYEQRELHRVALGKVSLAIGALMSVEDKGDAPLVDANRPGDPK